MSKSTFYEGRISTLLTIFLEHIWVRNPKSNRIGNSTGNMLRSLKVPFPFLLAFEIAGFYTGFNFRYNVCH